MEEYLWGRLATAGLIGAFLGALVAALVLPLVDPERWADSAPLAVPALIGAALTGAFELGVEFGRRRPPTG